ncbi:MmcQ/YjbR family DNA-binding protein [Saccharospirillum mangrovi]|uniref:MmcQ/YjbR family DNA-binding protein n=1 Tax=Saccharospirillum mangrovi TaxID=2161747 RepID=UPI000D37CA10|nr:MmcQ/YjbR family DNA-binding protein [Saccharospirillum mangrovi]
MNNEVEVWRERLSAKPGCTEETPFGPQALVYKVAGKMFALLMIDRTPLGMNLKCDPQQALIIRDTFSAVTPGYHMNKKHWNTIDLEAGLDIELVQSWIDDSYELVKQTLPKAVQARLVHQGESEGESS